MKTQKILLKTIRIGKHRALNKKKFNAIKESIEKIGLKTPPTVRPVDEGEFELVAGHHRIQALKELGRKKVRCFVIEKKRDARLWTIAENLHRADLQPIEQARSLKEWERLLKKGANDVQDAQPGGHQPHNKGVSSAAKALGMSRERVRRMRIIGSISKEVQAAARKAGLGDNKEALVKIGKEKTRKAQLKKVRELAKSRKATPRRGKWLENKQIERMTQALEKAKSFRREWGASTVPARLKFIKNVLKPNKR